ncbi:MAG: hypothetical protein COA58_05815 [Bacteroidetes bacterium]|nr:MAG: hypothetical protein COA58_05815 [Bacteroidota bacterium]
MQFLEPIIGGIAAFLVGFLWYTTLFGKQWQALTGMSDEDAKKDMARTHGLSLLMMIIMSFALNTFVINAHPAELQTFGHGMFHGAMIGVFYAATSTAINYLYQRKSIKLWLIDAGYQIVMLAVSGGVMAALSI